MGIWIWIHFAESSIKRAGWRILGVGNGGCEWRWLDWLVDGGYIYFMHKIRYMHT